MSMKQYTFTEPKGGDQSQGWAILAVTWSFVLCAFLTTVLRVWVRTVLTRNMGADDYVIIVALITTIVGAGFVTCLVIVGGLGRHSYYLSTAQKRNFQAIGWADWIQTFITLCLMKVSICLFLLRIVERKLFRIALWSLIAFLVLFSSTCVFLFIGVCRPLKAHWDIGIKDAKCLSDLQVENIAIAQGVLSVFTDLTLATFPVFFLRKLNVSMRTKISLCVLMGLGVITAACSVVRTALSGAMTNPDLTWAISANVAWRLPEVNIGIVCANAPALRPLYLWLRGRLDLSRTKASGSSGYSKERFMAPSNARWGANSATLQGSGGSITNLKEKSPGGAASVDEGVELEMGFPVPPAAGEGNLTGRKEVWA